MELILLIIYYVGRSFHGSEDLGKNPSVSIFILIVLFCNSFMMMYTEFHDDLQFDLEL